MGFQAFFLRLKPILDHFWRVKPFLKPFQSHSKAISLLKPFLEKVLLIFLEFPNQILFLKQKKNKIK